MRRSVVRCKRSSVWMQTMTCRRATVGPGDGVGAPRSDTVCGSGACGVHRSVVGGGNLGSAQPYFGSKWLLIIVGRSRYIGSIHGAWRRMTVV